MAPPSSTTAPQLSPVRPSSPLKLGDFAVGGDNQADEASVAELVDDMRDEDISPVPGMLESGAPETPEEAALGSPSPRTRSSTSTVTGLKSAGDKTVSKLATVSEGETTDNHAARRHPGEDTVSATIKRKNVAREHTIIEEEDEPEHDQEDYQHDEQSSEPGPLPPIYQSHLDKEKNFQDAIDLIEPKLINAPETITKEDANLLHSREQRVHGSVEKGGITALAQSLAARNEQETDAD